MAQYLIQRLVHSLVLLSIISVVAFMIIHAAPGTPSIVNVLDMDQQERERLIERLGLKQPMHIQYSIWLQHIIRGDLGRSIVHGVPVWDLIRTRIPATLALSGTAFLVALVVAIPLGVIAATRRASAVDYGVTSFTTFGIAIPDFWYALTLIIVFGVKLQWLPVSGMFSISGGRSVADLASHLILPVLVMATIAMAEITRFTRSSVLEVLGEDYVRTARAKGLSEGTVLRRHALRNALFPVVTVIGLLVPRFVGGAAITETVFAWPGVGRLAVEAAFSRDYPLIMSIVLFISIAVVISNLLTDLAYYFLDPRLRDSGGL